MLFRRTFIFMEEVTSKSSRRTIIRDPRKAKRIQSAAGVVASNDTSSTSKNNNLPPPQSQQSNAVVQPQTSFEPSVHNQQSLGLGSYMLAGVGVALGVTLVGAIFGAIG
ncbi:hypothetical protein ACHAXH_003393 [Discostella pseudostelligera]